MKYHCRVAWTGDRFQSNVLVTAEDGLITGVTTDAPSPPDATQLDGVVFPGFHNDHSHVFHRLLRGHVAEEPGDFWSWRDAMYEVAAGLDPDSYRQVAAATYREMVLAGYTSVVEFHYLHHQPDGRPYDDPNVMADALADAAAEAGIRLTLLDTCYLSAGFGQEPEGVQRRFSDGTALAWAERVSSWKPPGRVTQGAAIHSVRAVGPDDMGPILEWAADRPLHVHVSEQPAENQASLDHFGRTPTQVLADAGALGPNTTAVHATHVTASDIALLADSDTGVCVCPTTERWLADGIGPTGEMAAAGLRIMIGSDSQAVIDPWEEIRLLELHQRLDTRRTGTHEPRWLLRAGSGATLAPGQPADVVVIAAGSPRTAGVNPEGLVFAATAADVTAVVVAGSLAWN